MSNYAVFKLIGEAEWEQVTHWITKEAADKHSKLSYLQGYSLQIFMKVGND